MTSDEKFIAHRTEEGRGQTILQHTRGVEEYASKEGQKVGIEYMLKLAGIFHDAGKYQPEFQAYINKGTEEKVNHSSVGARMIYDYISQKGDWKLAELEAYGVAAHHGLFDCIELEKDRFYERLQKTREYDIAVKQFEREIGGEYSISQLYELAQKEWDSILSQLKELCDSDRTEIIIRKKFSKIRFYVGCLERLMLSVLIDADWKDTGEFIEQRTSTYFDYQKIFPEAYKNYEGYIKKLQNQRGGKSKKETEISLLREEIRKECILFAENSPGCYCLSIPTGGGKTLTSLGYALKYCQSHKEAERIIYVSPFISITEQNSKVIREAVGKEEWVLEHHSGVTEDNDAEEKKSLKNPFGETWEEPFIATTAVQFLNTLFSDRKQSIRRMHRLKNSVIIIDEVQSLPIKCIHTFNLMMNFLVKCCNATVILCTATQPLLECTDKPILYTPPKEMVGNLSQRFQEFERVQVIPVNASKRWSFQQIAEFVKEQLGEKDNALVILNSKFSVQKVYELLKDQFPAVYLTTNLCAEHRSGKIRQIKEQVKRRDGSKLVVISTPLIEAGVDISFQCVIRSLAGLDSIAQAAGRCNRNGELTTGEVFVIEVAEEHIDRMPDIWNGQRAAKNIIHHYLNNNEGVSLLDPIWLERYYKEYFFTRKAEMDYHFKDIRGKSIIQLLADGYVRSQNREDSLLNQAFLTAGKNYRPIDMNGIAVIVPYGDGKEIVRELRETEDWGRIRELLRKAQRYTVNLYEYKASELWGKSVIEKNEKRGTVIWTASEKAYDLQEGLMDKRPNMIF